MFQSKPVPPKASLSGKTLKEICNEFSCSKETAAKWKKLRGAVKTTVPTKEQLEPLSMAEAVAKYKVSNVTVQTWRRNYGINRLPGAERIDTEAIVKMIGEGKTNKEIHASVKCHPNSICKIRRELLIDRIIGTEYTVPFILPEHREALAAKAYKRRMHMNTAQFTQWLSRNKWSMDRGFEAR